MLEKKDALPRDFLLLLKCYFGNSSTETPIPYLTSILLLINELDSDDILDAHNTLSSASETIEANSISK